MNTLSILMKPVSAGCQMSCTYCFYKDVAENRSQKDFGLMREEVVATLLEKVFDVSSFMSALWLPSNNCASQSSVFSMQFRPTAVCWMRHGALFFINITFLLVSLWMDGAASIIYTGSAGMVVRMWK